MLLQKNHQSMQKQKQNIFQIKFKHTNIISKNKLEYSLLLNRQKIQKLKATCLQNTKSINLTDKQTIKAKIKAKLSTSLGIGQIVKEFISLIYRNLEQIQIEKQPKQKNKTNYQSILIKIDNLNLLTNMSLQSSILQQSAQRNFSTIKSQAALLKKNKSGIDLMKNYLLKKAENMYKLNLSDEQAFKWKFNKNKNNRPLSSFRLIKTQSICTSNELPNTQLQELMDPNFPVLANKTKQLSEFAMTILKNNQYFVKQINDEQFLRKLITQISLNYNIVSYHNFSHAFSLTLMLFQCFEFHHQLRQVFTEEERYYAMLAGLAHDMNHPGTNNAFQVKTKSPRALQFNNESVLQNFHLRQLWTLLQKNPSINFLNKVENPQQVKKRITYLVLMTDVAQHFKNLQKLKSLRLECESTNEGVLDKAQNRQFFLGQLFHACDIGNPCIDFEIYISWAALLSYEFNQQTMLQKQNQVEITEMLKYKDLTTFFKGQLGFINFMVFPLWKQISEVCGNLKVFTANIQTNVKMLNKKMQSLKEENQYAEEGIKI